MRTLNDDGVLEIAKFAHELNRTYCAIIGDTSQTKWEQAPDWQKQSAINGVKFHLNNPGAKPQDSHESWLKEKVEGGWKFGKIKDPDKKLHPCILPFNQLPAKQQFKDYLFLTFVTLALELDAEDSEGTDVEDDEPAPEDPQPEAVEDRSYDESEETYEN